MSKKLSERNIAGIINAAAILIVLFLFVIGALSCSKTVYVPVEREALSQASHTAQDSVFLHSIDTLAQSGYLLAISRAKSIIEL